MSAILNYLQRSWSYALHWPVNPRSAIKGSDRIHIDDLTEIGGIGLRVENRLYASGIKTYPKLAQTSPSELREILGNRVTDDEIENWLLEAAQKTAGYEN